MGVHGLWKLIEPAGKPVPLETLENKVLAVDVSIWLYQLTKGLQTTGGGAVPNAHILGLFNRICKLLYYRIKPVFVFDGGVPLLKKETIEARRLQKLKAKDSSEQLRERLLNNLLKQRAVNQLLGSEAVPSSSRQADADLFVLPPLPEEDENAAEESDGESDTEVGTAKVESFCNYQLGKDVHSVDITSAQFKSLPPEIRHEILSELQETRKQNSWGRIHEMPEESTDFSKYQMSRLMKRRNVQRSLDEAAKEIGGRPMTLGELEEIFVEEGIVTHSLPGRRIAGDNVTRYVYITGDKSENKTKETAPVIDEEKSTTTTPSPKKPSDIDESEFRNSLYEIDQCIFIKDSSSDDDDVSVVPENKASDLANQLSREEKISQEEILRLIKEQNARRNRASPPPSALPSALSEEPHSSRTGLTDQRPSSSRVQNEKPFSNLSDVEDDPEILGDSDSDVVEDSQETLKASQTGKPQQLNPDNTKVRRPSSELPEETGFLQPDLTPPDSDRASPDVIPDSGTFDSAADELVESPLPLDDSPQSDKTCQSEELFPDADASGYAKSMSKLDKMISSVTGGNSSLELAGCSKATVDVEADTKYVELLSDSESDDDMIEVTEAGNEESPYFEELKSQNLEIVIDPNRVCQDDLFSDVFEPVKKETSEVKENSEIEVRSNVTPKADETKKSAVVQKEDKRFKKLAEIFQKVKKAEAERKTVSVSEKSSEPGFTPEPQNEELLNVQKELHVEEMELQSERGKQERLGSTITQQMIIEAQELLQLFGLPYLVAPMEAEAQCAFLDQAQLTEGTITDDSDIWLFGGQKVYKNFFDNRKYVLQFRDVDIEHFFKLSREQLIQMAMLVGSDYTVGIEGVGPVTAIEILAYFSEKSNKPETEADIAETLRKFKRWIEKNRNGTSVLSRKVKNVSLSEAFPNTSVIEAYLYPTIDESKENFTWATPDLDRIRQYMKSKFGWKMRRIDEILLPVMKRQNDRNKQTTLDAFFKAKPHVSIDTGNISKRVIQAINIMKNKVDVDVTQLPIKSPRKTPSKKLKATPTKSSSSASPSPKKKPTTRASKNLLKTLSPHKSSAFGQEVIPQREKDRLEAAKRKLEAVKILQKNRKGKKAIKKRKTLKPKQDSSYLSESSSSEG